MSINHTFASDNTAGICPEAIAAINAVNEGHTTSYGEDELTTQAKRAIQEVFETECEVFFVGSGTVANALSLSALARNYQSILCHDAAHLNTDEGGAVEFFTGGAKVISLPGTPDAKLLPEEIEDTMSRIHGVNVHSPKPAVLSLTQATEFGTVYSTNEIQALSETARRHRLALHMDGARFANATAALGASDLSPADITWRAGIDVLSFGGTKNGMQSTEAVVFFNRTHAQDFECRVKQSGQLTSKLRFAAAQWLGMLSDGAWLRHATHANAMARRLSAGMTDIPDCQIQFPVETNGIFIKLPPKLFAGLEALGWHFYPFYAKDVYRLMCGWNTSAQDVDRFIAEAGSVVSRA